MTSILPITTAYPAKSNVYKNFANSAQKKKTQDTLTSDAIIKDFPWVKDKNIILALNELKQIKFDRNEVEYLKKIGVNIPFNSGEEAVEFLKNANARILFDEMPEDIHAQYDFSKNFIKITTPNIIKPNNEISTFFCTLPKDTKPNATNNAIIIPNAIKIICAITLIKLIHPHMYLIIDNAISTNK